MVIKGYHRWLQGYCKKCALGVPGYSYATDDILDEMEHWFKEPRDILANVLMAWDGTPASVGE